MDLLRWIEAGQYGVSEAHVHPALQGLVCQRGRDWRYSAGWSGDAVQGVVSREAEAKELIESHLMTCTLPSFLIDSVSVPNLDFNVSLSAIPRAAPGTKSAADALQTAIDQGAGIVTLVGAPGSGKTHILGNALHTVCRA